MEIGNPMLSEQSKSRLEQMGLWIHQHPMATKVAEKAGLILGVGLMAASPFMGAIALGVAGGILTTTATVAIFGLDILAPPHHDMKNHLFKPRECDGGRLYYEGDVPILSLDSDDPFKAGQAHGYLCGDAISRLSKRFALVLHTIAGQPRADKIPHTLAAVSSTIPAQYLREMEGLVDGYNQWAKEQSWWQSPQKLTLDDALLLHLMPDSLHFQPANFENRSPAALQQAVACSSIVERDAEDGFVFARNMDWPSFGLAGAYSLVIHRKHTNGLRSTVEVGVPGLVGTLTGMNDRDLSLSMNVCAGQTEIIAGMPASIYNRACLEECGSVRDVEDFVRKESPLGPYHMTIASPSEAKSIHFYQAPGGSHTIRSWQEGQPLATFNCRYNPQPSAPDVHHSAARQEQIDDFFKNRADRPIEDVQALPFVNNWITTHRVVMKPQTGDFQVAFDNAFAGSASLHPVPLQRLFQNP